MCSFVRCKKGSFWFSIKGETVPCWWGREKGEKSFEITTAKPGKSYK